VVVRDDGVDQSGQASVHLFDEQAIGGANALCLGRQILVARFAKDNDWHSGASSMEIEKGIEPSFR
jgi:hypothetical protein